ncbi:Serine/threonine protein kinase KIN1 [Diplonema papillatum]|nr:Serine/threonine protein kinase KIN1 [Diplonema papillatum]
MPETCGTVVSPGGRVGDRYKLGSFVGSGRWGSVFKGQRLTPGAATRNVALKERERNQMRTRAAARGKLVPDGAHEAAMLQRVHHANCVRLEEDFVDEKGAEWLVMELAPGVDLHRYVTQHFNPKAPATPRPAGSASDDTIEAPSLDASAPQPTTPGGLSTSHPRSDPVKVPHSTHGAFHPYSTSPHSYSNSTASPFTTSPGLESYRLGSSLEATAPQDRLQAAGAAHPACSAPVPSPEYLARRVAKQLVSALLHLHYDGGVVHCDLKPENVVVDPAADFSLKIVDFGAALALKDGPQEVATHLLAHTLCITAPEILFHASTLGSRPVTMDAESLRLLDIYSLGVTLYFIVSCGQYPYPMEPADSSLLSSINQLLHHIEGSPPISFDPSLTPECVDFISSCLKEDPRRRPTAKQLSKHPWMAEQR